MIKTELCELLNIKYPIFQGGMAWIADASLAAAVSNAGGLGIIAAMNANADWLREEIHKVRTMTDKPFGVNIMLMSPFADEVSDLVVEEKVPVVVTGAGNPGKYMKKWVEAGIKVIPVVASTAMARLVERSGATAVVAEGGEYGGHIGELTTMTLVPQVCDAVKIPVLAAGGIADGRQLTAAFALGAVGVQLGTCLLASSECPIHEAYKAAVIKAKDNDTIVTGRIAGTPVRILKNQMAREYVKNEKAGMDKMELEKFTLGSLRRAVFEGDTKRGSLMAGQVVGQLKEIKPIAEIFEELYKGSKDVLAKLTEEV